MGELLRLMEVQTATQAVRNGARRVNSLKRIWLIFYFANLLFSLVFAVPLFTLLNSMLGHSVYSDELMRKSSIDFITEVALLTGNSPAFTLGPLAIAVIAGYTLLNTFLTGGALALLAGERRPFRRGEFFANCGRWFWRLLLIAVVGLLLYALLFAANGSLSSAIGKAFQNGLEEWPVTVLSWVRVACFGLLAAFVNLVLDFAKIHAVAGWRRPLRSAIGFVRRRFGLAAGTYAIDALFALLFLLAYHGLSELIGQASFAAVLAVFVLRQAYLLARVWCRLLFWASEAQCLPVLETVITELAPEPAMEPLAEPEPVIPSPETRIEPETEP